MRDVILAEDARFGCEDSAGPPWIEIDFPQNLERARRDIYPRLIDRVATPR